MHIDTVEQHRELRRLELDLDLTGANLRQPEPTALEALVVEDEAASIPRQNLDAITATRGEDVEVHAVDVMTTLAHDRTKAIDRLAQIDGTAAR